MPAVEPRQHDRLAGSGLGVAPLPSTGPLSLWLALQLGVMLIAVLRIPLAAQYPEPAEALAAHLVYAAQATVAALTFPFLLRTPGTAVQVIATAWPFQLASGYLAAIDPVSILWSTLLLTTWLGLLAVYAWLLRTPYARSLGVMAATLLTAGLASMRYLRAEFGQGEATLDDAVESISPLLATFESLEGSGARSAWLMLAVLGGAAGTLLAGKLRRRTPADDA